MKLWVTQGGGPESFVSRQPTGVEAQPGGSVSGSPAVPAVSAARAAPRGRLEPVQEVLTDTGRRSVGGRRLAVAELGRRYLGRRITTAARSSVRLDGPSRRHDSLVSAPDNSAIDRSEHEDRLLPELSGQCHGIGFVHADHCCTWLDMRPRWVSSGCWPPCHCSPLKFGREPRLSCSICRIGGDPPAWIVCCHHVDCASLRIGIFPYGASLRGRADPDHAAWRLDPYYGRDVSVPSARSRAHSSTRSPSAQCDVIASAVRRRAA